jgi:hypothetical protein
MASGQSLNLAAANLERLQELSVLLRYRRGIAKRLQESAILPAKRSRTAALMQLEKTDQAVVHYTRGSETARLAPRLWR